MACPITGDAATGGIVPGSGIAAPGVSVGAGAEIAGGIVAGIGFTALAAGGIATPGAGVCAGAASIAVTGGDSVGIVITGGTPVVQPALPYLVA